VAGRGSSINRLLRPGARNRNILSKKSDTKEGKRLRADRPTEKSAGKRKNLYYGTVRTAKAGIIGKPKKGGRGIWAVSGLGARERRVGTWWGVVCLTQEHLETSFEKKCYS